MLVAAFRCYRTLGYWPNIEQPKTFNEKIQYRKFFQSNPLFSVCSDKIAVRDYVASKIGEEHLIPLLDTLDSPDKLKFDQYGVNYAVKCTHDSGGVFFVTDDNPNKRTIIKKLKKRLSVDNGLSRDEHWYSDIKPRIIVERLLAAEDGGLPVDYKFHVFSSLEGARVVLQIDYDRFNGHHRSFYSERGELLPYGQRRQNKKVAFDRPKKFDQMVSIAKTLAEDFDYARVDLYYAEDKVYFGELTFAHSSGFEKFIPSHYDLVWGEYWNIKR
ncbi:ATP-grasp fold amidoligase family protein [Teredinibacter purpureus]|uniref:ATP-grasp fold amidoligase family protein n=1 Tax=Teredinibacter purpureus TaxID=2731756 RepID=UPI0019101071|nr:ATP-grasp fold amidoligase family protein [Teredinibacter purpureus]